MVPSQDLSFRTSTDSVELTSALLQAELLEPYAKEVWHRFVHHKTFLDRGSLSIRAIARAISAHQRDRYGHNVSPQHYKDRVSRAISGEYISPETLDLFCETFNFPVKTARTLRLAMFQGFENSETLTLLRTSPQAVISNAFIELLPEDHDEVAFSATVVYLALETGCSTVLFHVPGSTEAECLSNNFDLFSSPEPGEWIITPKTFINPLEAFVLRFTLRVTSQIRADGLHLCEIPFPHRSSGVGIQFKSGGEKFDITFQEQNLKGKELHQPLHFSGIGNAASHFYPTITEGSITISWSSNEK